MERGWMLWSYLKWLLVQEKTITSLSAASATYKELGKLVLIVLVPYLHLLEQWERNCRMFGFSPISL